MWRSDAPVNIQTSSVSCLESCFDKVELGSVRLKHVRNYSWPVWTSVIRHLEEVVCHLIRVAANYVLIVPLEPSAGPNRFEPCLSLATPPSPSPFPFQSSLLSLSSSVFCPCICFFLFVFLFPFLFWSLWICFVFVLFHCWVVYFLVLFWFCYCRVFRHLLLFLFTSFFTF